MRSTIRVLLTSLLAFGCAPPDGPLGFGFELRAAPGAAAFQTAAGDCAADLQAQTLALAVTGLPPVGQGRYVAVLLLGGAPLRPRSGCAEGRCDDAPVTSTRIGELAPDADGAARLEVTDAGVDLSYTVGAEVEQVFDDPERPSVLALRGQLGDSAAAVPVDVPDAPAQGDGHQH